jgi:hypothetical protein
MFLLPERRKQRIRAEVSYKNPLLKRSPESRSAEICPPGAPSGEATGRTMSSNNFLSRFRQVIAQIVERTVPLDLSQFHSLDEQLVDIESYIQQQRLWCGIIDAMTPLERGNPSMILDGSRVERIALGSGTTTAQVVDLVTRFGSPDVQLERAIDVLLDDKVPFFQSVANWMPNIRFAGELCEKTHAKMLAGNCPWCGCGVISQEESQ